MIDRNIHKNANAEIIISASTSPPGCRIVMVEACPSIDNEGNPSIWAEAIPIIGIRTVIADRYHKLAQIEEYPEVGHSHASMMAIGWKFTEREVRSEFLVWSQDFGLVTDEEASMTNSVSEVVFCSWPESEDATRLTSYLDRVRSKVEVRKEEVAS